MTYDPDNRLITEDFSNPSVDVDNYTNTYSYDDANNQTELIAPTGTVSRHFSGRNNRLWEANADDRRVTYTYDCAENRDTMMDADNGLFTYTHDAKNRLTSVINPKNEITTIGYDQADRETRRDLADTTFTTRDYDNAGRIDVLSNERFAGSVISRFTYTYDCADNRTDVAELDGTRVTWTYDRKYQLLSEFRDDTSPASSYRNTYTYDPTGNRLQKVASESTTTYVYDACNELNHEATWQHADPAGTRVNIVYTYDECGNRIERDPDDLGATTYYTYDAQNRVIEVNPGAAVELSYNADDQRIEKEAAAGTTKYIFDFKKLLQETDGMDDTTALYTGTLKDEFGDLVSQFREDASGFYQYDATGSASELTDASAAVKNLYVFEAFGTPAHEVTDTNFPNNLNWIGSQGYYNDLEFDYYFLGKRMYDALTGQFTRPDPIGLEGGTANLVEYVGNNPINATDPSGLELLVENKETGALVAKWIYGAFGQYPSVTPLGGDSEKVVLSLHAEKNQTIDERLASGVSGTGEFFTPFEMATYAALNSYSNNRIVVTDPADGMLFSEKIDLGKAESGALAEFSRKRGIVQDTYEIAMRVLFMAGHWRGNKQTTLTGDLSELEIKGVIRVAQRLAVEAYSQTQENAYSLGNSQSRLDMATVFSQLPSSIQARILHHRRQRSPWKSTRQPDAVGNQRKDSPLGRAIRIAYYEEQSRPFAERVLKDYEDAHKQDLEDAANSSLLERSGWFAAALSMQVGKFYEDEITGYDLLAESVLRPATEAATGRENTREINIQDMKRIYRKAGVDERDQKLIDLTLKLASGVPVSGKDIAELIRLQVDREIRDLEKQLQAGRVGRLARGEMENQLENLKALKESGLLTVMEGLSDMKNEEGVRNVAVGVEKFARQQAAILKNRNENEPNAFKRMQNAEAIRDWNDVADGMAEVKEYSKFLALLAMGVSIGMAVYVGTKEEEEEGNVPKTGPIKAGETTTFQDFVNRSKVGDKLEGHELWQHANLKAKGLATERLSTTASKNNPVIALDRATHVKVNAAQRALNAADMTPLKNIEANADILRNLNAAPESVIKAAEEAAIRHTKSLGY